MAQVIINTGADVAVKEDAVIIIKTSLRNGGYLANESKIIIEGDFTNTDTTEGISIDTFDISGNWTNSKAFVTGQSTVVLSGSSQTIRGTTPTTFYNLYLTGTGVKSLDTVDAVISNQLNLNDREFSSKAEKISVISTDTAAIVRTTGFISSLNGGFLERYMDDTLDYLFPLGSTVGIFRYRPLLISPGDSGTVAIAARLANTDASNENFDRANRSDEVCDLNALFYHQIQRSLDTIPVSITMYYDSASDGRWSQIAHWQNTPRWEMGGLAAMGTDSVFTTVTINNYENFDYSPFALMAPIPMIDTTQTVITDASCNNGNDGSICVSYPPLSGTPPFQYSWSTGDTTPCINGLTAGEYTLHLSDSLGCANTYTFTIKQPNNIIITSSITNVSCNGGEDGSICINSVTGDFPPFTYFITGTSNEFDSCLNGLFAGEYSVTIKDSTGCSIILPNNVITEPELLTVSVQWTDVTCFGFDDGETAASPLGGTPPYHYQWVSLPNVVLPDDTLETATELAPGDYGVTVTDGNGCIAENGSVSISQPNPLVVIAGPDKTIFTGFSATLEVISVSGGRGEVAYEWSPTSGVDDPLAPNTTTTPEATTTYTIKVTDENQCIATDTLRVQVDVNDYTFPNAFIPNGTANRYFKPVQSVTAELQRLEVYNRWGKKLFETTDPSTPGWDGKHEGKLQPMDTYVYQAVLRLPDGTQKSESGDFILIW